MDFGLKNKKALVLAASQGLGFAVALALAKEGAEVVIVGRDKDRLQKAQQTISQSGGKAHFIALSLDDVACAETIYHETEKLIGNVDILINNNGGPAPGPIKDVAMQDWQKYFDSMVLSLMRLGQLCLANMQKNGWGRIVTIGSSGIKQPINMLGVSNSLRMALWGWTKTLANQVGKDGVTVNMVLPGRIATSRIAQLDAHLASQQGQDIAAIQAQQFANIPVGRYGKPEEFAAAVAFLCSSHGSYITGHALPCDGGMINTH